MSWPSIWQTPDQNQGTGAAQTPVAMNMPMFQLSAEQQYALQQQNWQQWQMYQNQLAQWQAQYGEQFQQMQSDMMTTQNIVSNPYMQSVVPPPPPVEHQPPPPPPPQQQQNTQNIRAQVASIVQQTNNFNETVSNKEQQQQQQPSISQPNKTNPTMSTNNQSQQSTSAQTHEKNTNHENSNYSQQNQDGFRKQNQLRNNRWSNNIQNNRNNRMFGGNNNFNNRNTFDRNDHVVNDDDTRQQNEYANEEKSQEEMAFDIQYRRWEDSFMEWKKNNANHPDRNQYNDFVTKMEGCRTQLSQRREMLRQKRLDAIRDAQIQQNNQNLKTENQSETFESNQVEKNIASTQSIDDRTVPASGLFTTNNDGIPGLDLVNEEKPSKADINIVAHVNNILGNPEIQSLLSNIQRKQSETDPPKQHLKKDVDDRNEDSSQIESNQTVDPIDNASNFENYKMNNETSQCNPFRQNNRDDHVDQPKHQRRWNENTSSDNSPQFEHYSRNRNNFAQQQSTKQDFGAAPFKNNNNSHMRTQELDSSKNTFNMTQNDCEEFRPMKIIDYQNRTQNQLSSFENRQVIDYQNRTHNQPSSSADNFPSNRLQPYDYFPRKIIEYDHKTKVHPWEWFCPVFQIEYNHTKNGFSLHEHPPIKLEVKVKPEFKQLRQPQWAHGPNDRQERFSQGQQQQNYQPRYENRQNISSNTQPTNEMYQRRNSKDKSWPRNFREWKTPYDRWPESRNVPERNDYSTLPNTSSSPYQRIDTAIKVEPNPKFNLKDLLFPPGRKSRPKRFVVILRGIPGSGKSYLSKMIKDKEQEMGGSARILSIDDYFMAESDSEAISKKHAYEYDAKMEESYTQYLLRTFRKTCTDNLFDCIIVDCKNTKLHHLTEFYTIAKSHMFTPYICELPLDVERCVKNNIHNRTESEIRHAFNEWEPTPSSYTILDYECLFDRADDTEEISDADDDKDDGAESLDAISDDENGNDGKNVDDDFSDVGGDDEPLNEFGVFKSKWDNDTTENKLARLDGTNKPIKHATIEDYLQMDGWEPPAKSTNGKKRVRWADIEDKREQDKQRAIGFVVGQTNWNNLIEPRDHKSALTKIKYIEKVRKN